MARLLLIAHAPLASALRAAAAHTYPEQAGIVDAIDVQADTPPEQIEREARALMARTGAAETLVLTDVFGGTPANVASWLADGRRVRCVVGVNVPMLWRALNYSELPLAELARRAMDGAVRGVMALASTRPQEQGPGAPGHGKKHDHDQ